MTIDSASILVVEDDPAIVDILHICLTQAGYKVTTAQNTSDALAELSTNKPDLLLLDWMLPDEDGVQFFRQIRANTKYRDVAVIMITARVAGDEQVFALDQGVDDYISKPFSQKVLLARIRLVLRRTATMQELSIGNLSLNTGRHQLSLRTDTGNKTVQLYPVESSIMTLFMKSTGRVYTREILMSNINKSARIVELRTIDVHISRLRRRLKKIGIAPIKTARGVGYFFEFSNAAHD